MEKINIYDVKTYLSKLINDVVATGEPFLIARHGKVVAKVVPYREEERKRKLGFLAGQFVCPADFDDQDVSMNDLFEGNEDNDLSA